MSSSSDTVFGIAVYGDHHGKPWHKATVMPVYRLWQRVKRVKYWVWYRTTRKGRECWRPDHGLKPGWYDSDTLILHSSMAVLCRFIEQEHDGAADLQRFTDELLRENHPPDEDMRKAIERQADGQQGALDLYRWWKVERPADEKRRDELMSLLYGKPRMKTKPVEGQPLLVEWVRPEYTEEEQTLHTELGALEKKIADDETAMLHRLVDLRGGMWT